MSWRLKSFDQIWNIWKSFDSVFSRIWLIFAECYNREIRFDTLCPEEKKSVKIDEKRWFFSRFQHEIF